MERLTKILLQSRVVNGVFTGVNEFSMMAGLVDTGDRYVFCGGTIISNSYVLTSAHCLSNRATTSLSVLVGDHEYTTSMLKFQISERILTYVLRIFSNGHTLRSSISSE